MKIIIKLCLLLMTLACTGCCHWLDTLDLRDETVYPPSLPIDHPPPPKTNGAIYQAGYQMSLYEDHVARHIGDILTVRLEEQTQGEKQSKMKTDKNTLNNTDNASQLQGSTATGALKPELLGGVVNSLIFNTGSALQFDGKGETHENNKLHGTISVTVTCVLSNGNMVIGGESWITINQGREYIRLTGIVRPEDIEANNNVSSQRLANARIAYSGSGQVGNAARGGLLTQFLFKFFPY